MIDFRYHLVSLISVFLALAVGIVLGAGPLKEPIASSLTRDVASLRQEKDTLHASLLTADAGLAHRDDFTTAIIPTLVAGQLTGRSVAVLSLPGVNGDDVTALVNAIDEAGGEVSSRISVASSWVDAAHAADREKVVRDLTGVLPNVTSSPNPSNTASTTGTDVELSDLLAGAVVSDGSHTVVTTAPTSAKALDALRSANLIAIKGKVTGLADVALMLAPANPVADGKVVPTPAGTPQSQYVTLATSLQAAGGGLVVSGPASSATGGGVLAAIRDDNAAKSVISTVDTGTLPMGVITAVLALREQLAGGSGSYGFAGGASALLPSVSASAATGK